MSNFTSPAGGGRGYSEVDRDEGMTLRLSVDPSRSMKAITADVEALLDDRDHESRHRGGLLASELIAQVVARDPDWNSQPVGLTVQLREDAIRLTATGPVTPAIETDGRNVVADDPIADWGTFLIDRLSDRWGLGRDSTRVVWAEIETPG